MKTRELFWGKDIRKAFPAGEYHIEPSEAHILPDELYFIEEYKYQSNTVVFSKIRIWQDHGEG